MFILRRCLLAFFALFAALPVHAQDEKEILGVVELFTSQGCGACPPADEAMQKMIEAGTVIGLSYHIDYWDYLGWVDTLATPGNTQRQYDYAEAMERSGVYTPQAIINGQLHLNGGDTQKISDTLNQLKASGEGLSVAVTSLINASDISIDIAAGASLEHAEVVIVYFSREDVVEVQRGDNAGKRISYWHNVTDVQVIGKWDGKASRFTLPRSQLPDSANAGLAVLLQRLDENGNPRAIIGASLLLSKTEG